VCFVTCFLAEVLVSVQLAVSVNDSITHGECENPLDLASPTSL